MENRLRQIAEGKRRQYTYPQPSNGQLPQDYPNLDDKLMDANRRIADRSNARGNVSDEALSKARQRYIAEQRKVIHGQSSNMFSKQKPWSTNLAQINSTSGSGLASVYGTPSQPHQTEQQKRNSDFMSALRYFAHPETDILAYHRRIEYPQSYQKSPVFGF